MCVCVCECRCGCVCVLCMAQRARTPNYAMFCARWDAGALTNWAIHLVNARTRTDKRQSRLAHVRVHPTSCTERLSSKVYCCSSRPSRTSPPEGSSGHAKANVKFYARVVCRNVHIVELHKVELHTTTPTPAKFFLAKYCLPTTYWCVLLRGFQQRTTKTNASVRHARRPRLCGK